MPQNSGLNQAEIEKTIKHLTRKIGVAKRDNDAQTLYTLRRRRFNYMVLLAEEHERFTLINETGATEFVDRGEFETRMVAWARRQGVVPRGAVDLRAALDATPDERRARRDAIARDRATRANHPENQPSPDAPPSAPSAPTTPTPPPQPTDGGSPPPPPPVS